ncbi:Hypothetical protein CINCED_3A010180 [Cinara cedri]|uniref:Uncharacterized protein n=1 Tax=Cinara cedri TaxID=506608 RepID=A0A5E4MGR0_9HEMI|nr:Hypothetical protein CINCED_3A010180 [Cinara cedri]
MLEHRSRKARSYKTVAVPVCLNVKAVYLRLVSSPINGSVPRCLRSVRHLSRAHDRRLNYGDQFQRRRPAVPSTANSTTAPAVIPVADRSSARQKYSLFVVQDDANEIDKKESDPLNSQATIDSITQSV